MGTKKPADLVRNIFQRQSALKRSLLLLAKTLPLALLTIILTVIGIDRWVSYQTDAEIFTSEDQVNQFDVAVVLGTSKYLGRTLNEYYSHRIDAAIELFQQDKVTNFLLSGDNAHRSYNEPWTMKRDLLRAEVPEDRIYLDYAGFRTLDSIVRAKEIFDTDNFLIISQKFHCERALFIAKHHNINASCFAVPGPTNPGYKVRLREVFARTKAFLDLYVLDAKPKFLGPKEPIIKVVEENPEIEDVEANLTD
ncbi:SanA/YdcF family protein [Vibrio sp. TRT 21S02]|uniref:SanA/YdcF family protein n=1 Tax=unclassified Vibrio TaxID=2614977 RepID=UPI00349FA696